MTEPPSPGARRNRRLSVYVAAWVMGAIVLAGVVGRGATAAVLPHWSLATALAVSVAVTSLVHVNIFVRGTREAVHLNELALVPVMVLLAPLPAMIVTMGGTMVGEDPVAGPGAQGRIQRRLAGRGRRTRFLAVAAPLALPLVGLLPLLDREGRVEVWNPRMEALTGLGRDDAEGQSLAALGCAHLLTPDGAGPRAQTNLGERVVEVRRSGLGASSQRSDATVLSVRDVSREAEIARIHEDLVSRISHEFRTPVTMAVGFLDTLEARWDDLSDPRRRELVAAAARGARRLGGLTANMMALSRIERCIEPRDVATPVAIQPVDPRPVIEEVVESLVLPADITISSEAGARVWMDPGDLRLVLANLLDNAARYGGPPIGVAVLSQEVTVAVKVFDHGPGVPAPFADQLFQRFTQASEGLQRTARGMGLGLAVVHCLVVANDGQVRYHSLPEGGACFTATLPAAPSASLDGRSMARAGSRGGSVTGQGPTSTASSSAGGSGRPNR